MPSPLHVKSSVQEKVAFETKALHFISKAIKGDYHVNDFTLNERIGSSRVQFSDQKENQILFQEEASKFQDKIPRKSGLLKSPSPLRAARGRGLRRRHRRHREERPSTPP